MNIISFETREPFFFYSIQNDCILKVHVFLQLVQGVPLPFALRMDSSTPHDPVYSKQLR